MNNPSALMNRLVYDSFEPSPLYDRRDNTTDCFVSLDAKQSVSSHNQHIEQNKLADLSSIFNNLSMKKEEKESIKEERKASVQQQIDEIKNLDIW